MIWWSASLYSLLTRGSEPDLQCRSYLRHLSFFFLPMMHSPCNKYSVISPWGKNHWLFPLWASYVWSFAQYQYQHSWGGRKLDCINASQESISQVRNVSFVLRRSLSYGDCTFLKYEHRLEISIQINYMYLYYRSTIYKERERDHICVCMNGYTSYICCYCCFNKWTISATNDRNG